MQPGIELTKLAEIAHRILDHSRNLRLAANCPRSEPRTSSQQPGVNFSEERLAKVEKQLCELATTVKST
jgi:hypothetical protein